MAWVILGLAIALAILPAVGTAWTLFYFSLSVYLWQAIVGLAVVIGVLAAAWALWTLIFK